MPEHDHPTRSLLLDTALTLVDDRSLSAIAIDEIVKAADVAKGTFYVHFANRTAFLEALHDHFHEQLRRQMAEATADLPAGRQRLRRGSEAYLDGCLRLTGVKAMLAHARGEPSISRKVSESNDRFATSSAEDFRQIDARHPLERARLFVASVAETALLELDAGRRQPKLRATLWEIFDL